jgi:cytochrome c oxidase cbb3-type subunit I
MELPTTSGILQLLLILVLIVVLAMAWAVAAIQKYLNIKKHYTLKDIKKDLRLSDLDEEKINVLLKLKNKEKANTQKVIVFITGILLSNSAFAQAESMQESLAEQPGIIITILLIVIPLLLITLFLLFKVVTGIRQLGKKQKDEKARMLAGYISNLNADEIGAVLSQGIPKSSHHLDNSEQSGFQEANDKNGIIRKTAAGSPVNFVPSKTRALNYPKINPGLGKLILWYLGCATFWLIFGTTIGEYLGIKFVAPDIDHQSWLSFGVLRPIHTNAVFWGWSSLAMLGLGYYVVPIVSNTSIFSLRQGYITLLLINTCVVAGSLCLMAGINNGGGEYREYIWPVMILFAAGLVISLRNFLLTIAKRATREIYISNWYIVSAVIFVIIIAVIAYWPSWQNGLGETIVQGYYMHQGVGMWFMLFTLGLVYYFLPQQLNKPIYSYSLGILAFWTQILFYTVIGTHHFVFSAIPWSLQTVAIVGSVGMLIPVTAGTVNFLMTFKGGWHKVGNSYILPFFLVGIIFYFTGSYQGTAEAFRYTNQLWHFTDFTVAHSHLTMYGIIAFLLWGCIYAIIPRITGKEPPQVGVGVHFWLALIGLMFYTIPLMIGGTLKGLQWMDKKPFIDSVVMMAPFWLWRAIGGTLMWLSHWVFAFNFYRMVQKKENDIQSLAFQKLREQEVALK